MAQVQIQSISHRHEAIADWLLANPEEKNLEGLCEHLNVTRSWLSVVMRSSVFREYFAKRRADWEANLMGAIGQKQMQVALGSLKKLEDIITDSATDPRLIFDIATKTTERLGFAPSKTRVKDEIVQEGVRPIQSDVLQQAREIFRRTITVEHDQLPAP